MRRREAIDFQQLLIAIINRTLQLKALNKCLQIATIKKHKKCTKNNMYICIGIFQSVHKVHGGHCQVHHVRNRTEQFSWSMSQSPIGPVNTKTYMMVCLVFTTLAWRTTKYNLPNIPRILFTSFLLSLALLLTSLLDHYHNHLPSMLWPTLPCDYKTITTIIRATIT